MAPTPLRQKLLASVVKDYLKDTSFKPVLKPALRAAFNKELQQQQDSAHLHRKVKESSSMSDVPVEAVGERDQALSGMPTLQETVAAEREEWARKVAGSGKKEKKGRSGTKRLFKDLDTAHSEDDSDSEEKDVAPIEEREFAKATFSSVETPVQATKRGTSSNAGMTPKEIEARKEQSRMETEMQDWLRQRRDYFDMLFSKGSMEDYFATKAAQKSHTSQGTAEEVAEEVGQRLENRNKPIEWKAETIDDPISWTDFYDNFKRHILHKGRLHPRSYIAPRLLRTLEPFMLLERSLEDWNLLSNEVWLEAVNNLLSKRFGWATTLEEVTLHTKDMVPQWEDFIESCQPMLRNRTLTEKEKKRKVVDAILAGGYPHESLELRELIEKDSIDFKSFLQPAAVLLGDLATVAKRVLRKNGAAVQDSKRRRSETSTVMTITPTPPVIKCSNCLKIGHVAKDCRLPLTCHLCHQTGHFSKFCPRRGQQGRGLNDSRGGGRNSGGRRGKADYNKDRPRYNNNHNHGRQMPRQPRPPMVAFTNENNSGNNSNSLINTYNGNSNMNNSNNYNDRGGGNSHSNNSFGDYNRGSDNRFYNSNNNFDRRGQTSDDNYNSFNYYGNNNNNNNSNRSY